MTTRKPCQECERLRAEIVGYEAALLAVTQLIRRILESKLDQPEG